MPMFDEDEIDPEIVAHVYESCTCLAPKRPRQLKRTAYRDKLTDQSYEMATTRINPNDYMQTEKKRLGSYQLVFDAYCREQQQGTATTFISDVDTYTIQRYARPDCDLERCYTHYLEPSRCNGPCKCAISAGPVHANGHVYTVDLTAGRLRILFDGDLVSVYAPEIQRTHHDFCGRRNDVVLNVYVSVNGVYVLVTLGFMNHAEMYHYEIREQTRVAVRKLWIPHCVRTVHMSNSGKRVAYLVHKDFYSRATGVGVWCPTENKAIDLIGPVYWSRLITDVCIFDVYWPDWHDSNERFLAVCLWYADKHMPFVFDVFSKEMRPPVIPFTTLEHTRQCFYTMREMLFLSQNERSVAIFIQKMNVSSIQKAELYHNAAVYMKQLLVKCVYQGRSSFAKNMQRMGNDVIRMIASYL